MRIKSVYVNNFKSLVDFNIDLAKFNCFIGLNGSGKSTFLQFIDFLAQIMKGKICDWLDRRIWECADLNSHLIKKSDIIKIRITFSDCDNSIQIWESDFSISKKQCITEKIIIGNQCFEVCRKADHGLYRVTNLKDFGEIHSGNIIFRYEGSVFSVLEDPKIPGVFYEFREYCKNIEAFDLLAPQELRKRARESHGSIGLGGEYFSAFLHELKPEKIRILEAKLKEIYPQLCTINLKTLRFGWKALRIEEQYSERRITTESRHISDGILRVLAILSQLETNRQFLLLDEIENGINPELVGFLVDTLTDTEKQIAVSTHSPLFLNYLDDALAEESVKYFYRTSEGYIRSIPFFEIPSIKKKLGILGAGEAFADTDLIGLAYEIERITTPAKKGD